ALNLHSHQRSEEIHRNIGQILPMLKPAAEPPAPGPATKHQAVVLIHGIRTRAEWQAMVQRVLSQDGRTTVIPLKYGFLNGLCFWLPPLFGLRKSYIHET